MTPSAILSSAETFAPTVSPRYRRERHQHTAGSADDDPRNSRYRRTTEVGLDDDVLRCTRAASVTSKRKQADVSAAEQPSHSGQFSNASQHSQRCWARQPPSSFSRVLTRRRRGAAIVERFRKNYSSVLVRLRRSHFPAAGWTY